MSLETDMLFDRRRLKRRLVGWRVVAVLALLGCVLIGLGRGGLERSGLGFARPRVARVTISGLITDDSKLIDRVRGLADDDSVKALIIDIDSPGGTVAGGEGLHDAIATVAARKPVAAVMHAMAASAGYMVAVPAQRIFAQDATLTGSIGVLLQTGEVSGLLQKIGVTAEAITSGPLKDQPSLTSPLTDQGRAVLHGLVMDLYDQFVGMVAEGRHMDPAKVRSLADGRAYTGRQALALGLVDQIGGEPAARAWLADHGVSAKLPVEDVKPHSWSERMLGASTSSLLGTILADGAKTVWAQSVTLDGAWALWQPSQGER
jgi:protease-4